MTWLPWVGLDIGQLGLIPRGPLKLLEPLLRRRMQGQELDNLRSIKKRMESLAAR